MVQNERNSATMTIILPQSSPVWGESAAMGKQRIFFHVPNFKGDY
jgi:hypothetical protein